MAKSKQQRAFFEILAKERGLETKPPEPVAAPQAPRPAPRPQPIAAMPPKIRPQPVPSESVGGLFAAKRVTVTYYQLAVVLMTIALLCAIMLAIGMHCDGPKEPTLPTTEPDPSIEKVMAEPQTPGLVTPPATEIATTAVGGSEHATEAEPLPPAEPPAAGEGSGRYRLRIAKLEVARASYTDRLRDFLDRNGVGTVPVPRRGYLFLYGTARFEKSSDEKAEAYRKKVVALLKAFAQQTKWQTSTDAYFVVVE